MTINSLFDELFYTGSGSTELVPNPFDIALNGRPYVLDDSHEAFKTGMQTIPLLRQQSDTSTLPGEGSTNPEDLWPRPMISWHMGAGQRFFDRGDSNPSRFWNSFGVDCWTYGKLKPLPSCTQVAAYAGANLCSATAGIYKYVSTGIAGQVAKWINGVTADGTLAISGAPVVRDIASDGYTVWVATASNVQSTVRGSGSITSYNALVCTLLDYVKDRLMAAEGRAIYNITSGSTPTALFTHPSLDWNWVGFTSGNSSIYAAGYAGDKSSIYRIGIKEDGTGLDVPLVAASLPDGEVVTAICGYLGFVAVGTSKGFRLAIENSDGSLTIGALVDLDRAVTAFEPQDRFIFFSYSNFSDGHTGLGRMDLSVFSDTAARIPAYASDIMALAQGKIVDIATLNDKSFRSMLRRLAMLSGSIF